LIRARLAGIIALSSLVVPSVVYVGEETLLHWLVVFYDTIKYNAPIFSNIFTNHSLNTMERIFPLLAFIGIIVGAFVLLISPLKARVGGIIVLVGFVFGLINLVIIEEVLFVARGVAELFIPLGLILTILASIIGISAKTTIIQRQETLIPPPPPPPT
jgi:hypothetical protein